MVSCMHGRIQNETMGIELTLTSREELLGSSWKGIGYRAYSTGAAHLAADGDLQGGAAGVQLEGYRR